MRCKRLLALLLCAVLLTSSPLPVVADEVGMQQSIDQLAGEDHLYAIDFLFFKELAAGEMRLSKTDRPNVYKAELVGRTLGVASWLAGDRRQAYTALMEQSPDGSLRSMQYVANVTRKRWGKQRDSSRSLEFDYVQGTVSDVKSKDGVSQPKAVHQIPQGQQPVDMLTAFYNLRTGVYGPLEHGARFSIPTYAKGAFPTIEVSVLTEDEQAKQDYFPAHGLLIRAIVDQEVFGSDSGTLYFWIDNRGLLERGIVEDIIGLGDIKGYLTEKSL